METIAVLDFGGQYTHLLARRIRQLGVYSTIVDPAVFVPTSEIGLIFSGGPRSVTEAEKLSIRFDVNAYAKPILGICYGHQLMASLMGGSVAAGHTREYGLATVTSKQRSALFHETPETQNVWMSHGDHVTQLPPDFFVSASSPDMAVAAYENKNATRFGVQFHPEVVHSQYGKQILGNFVARCHPKSQWSPQNRVQELIAQTQKTIGDRKALLLLSGGVDSLVAWAICNKALPAHNLTAIHVDTGLMRKNESANIMDVLAKANFTNVHLINAEKEFLEALAQKYDPEEKRKIIGTKFVEIANNAVTTLCGSDPNVVLVQGTIYPDTIESGGTKNAAKIKTHHNRVDAIQNLISQGRICEPLAELYKDEVREVGIAVGLPHELVYRHPFPGPGLGVRLLCSNTSNPSTKIPEECAQKFSELAPEFGFCGSILPIKSVGVQGDGRTYAHPGMLWAPNTELTPELWTKAGACARKSVNLIPSINRVVVCLNPQNSELSVAECYTTPERLNLLREVDEVATRFCTKETEIWQAPVVGLPLRNEKGDWAFVIRPVHSVDGMTADFFPLPTPAMQKMLAELKKIPGVGPIFYDVTSKPPATIEWE